MDIFAVEAYTASWIEIFSTKTSFIMYCVEAYTASWIEIVYKAEHLTVDEGRSLYGFVD